MSIFFWGGGSLQNTTVRYSVEYTLGTTWTECNLILTLCSHILHDVGLVNDGAVWGIKTHIVSLASSFYVLVYYFFALHFVLRIVHLK